MVEKIIIKISLLGIGLVELNGDMVAAIPKINKILGRYEFRLKN